ncbi:MAG: redox-regulated ATPase YchF [Candidatus Pacearchaeota archaeon]
MLIGIVGKPNVGKSTFFKAATLAEVAIAPYPFTTIKPNEGVGFVRVECPDKELGVKCKPNHGFCLHNQRFIPIKLLDVAGLVPGAHQGKGLGNQFLDDLRQADVLIHVVDASGLTNEEGKPTEGYDPCRDIKFLEEEIDMWFYTIITRNWKTLTRKLKLREKPIKEFATQFSGLKINEEMIKKAIKIAELDENFSEWQDAQIMKFVKTLRKLSKPIIIAANKVDLPSSKENIEKIKKEFPDLLVIPCSAECELALREAAKDNLIEYVPGDKDFKILHEEKLNERQKKALGFIREKILSQEHGTGVQQCLNAAVFDFLEYIVVYPVENETHFSDSKGNVLPDAFLMPKESKVIDLAFAIHTEIGKNFVAAIDARTKKRLAKDYMLKNKDIIKIITK